MFLPKWPKKNHEVNTPALLGCKSVSSGASNARVSTVCCPSVLLVNHLYIIGASGGESGTVRQCGNQIEVLGKGEIIKGDDLLLKLDIHGPCSGAETMDTP